MSDPDKIEKQIERTREELGDTVDALADKLDVKAHVKHTLEQTKGRMPAVLLCAAGVAGLCALVIWRRRRA